MEVVGQSFTLMLLAVSGGPADISAILIPFI
jgi:hypothetical protein